MNHKHPTAGDKRFDLWHEKLPPADRLTSAGHDLGKSAAPHGSDSASVPGSGSLVFQLVESPATFTDPHTSMRGSRSCVYL